MKYDMFAGVLVPLSVLCCAAVTNAEDPQVLLETSKGNITVRLFADKAPISTNNFLQYVKDGYYNGTLFHRVIPGFMVQGGGLLPGMTPKGTERAPIKNEADNGLKNKRGTLAMARTSAKDSATSQFFINLVDNAFLDHGSRDFGYAVFGEVVQGMDVVDAIAKVATTTVKGYQDAPKDDVLIKKAVVTGGDSK